MRRFFWIAKVSVVCAIVVTATGILTSVTAPRPAPQATETCRGELDGVIYFQELGCTDRLWSMRANGKSKRLLPQGICGEPSQRLHDGRRWFLTTRDVVGERYPDGSTRHELYAVREDGLSAQLTNDPCHQPAPLRVRWPVHAQDRMVSWVARRWDSDGRVKEGGIYMAATCFNENGELIGLERQPEAPIVRRPLVSPCGSWVVPGPVPDIESHDWSPDGRWLVYDSIGGAVRVTDLDSGQDSQLVKSKGFWPVWSPDGAAIAFRVFEAYGAIATVRIDRGESITVVSGEWGRSCVSRPVFSPGGRHLAFVRAMGDDGLPDEPLDVDVVACRLDGSGKVNLTPELGDQFVPIAWR